MVLSHEVIVNKPIQAVWNYSNNPENLSLWLNDFLRYEQLTGDVTAPGVGDTSRLTYRQGKGEFSMDETITVYDPPNRVELEMVSGYFDMKIVNTFEEVEPGRTRLLASADFVRVGWLMKIVFFFSSKSKMQSDHEKQINRLKELIEDEV